MTLPAQFALPPASKMTSSPVTGATVSFAPPVVVDQQAALLKFEPAAQPVRPPRQYLVAAEAEPAAKTTSTPATTVKKRFPSTPRAGRRDGSRRTQCLPGQASAAVRTIFTFRPSGLRHRGRVFGTRSETREA